MECFNFVTVKGCNSDIIFYSGVHFFLKSRAATLDYFEIYIHIIIVVFSQRAGLNKF